jgi:glycosyltransferase involved in cell wall biosynthesis
LRIVLVSDYYFPHVGGGVERVVEELAHNFVKFGHEVRVVTFNPDGWPSKERIDGVEIVRIPSVNLEPMVGVPAALNTSLGMRRLFEDADVIHTHNIFFLLSILSFLSRPKAPIITTMHVGSLSNLTGFTGAVGRVYERTVGQYILRRSRAVTAVSPSVAEHAANIGAGAPVHIIPNSVDVERFRPAAAPDGEPEDDRSVLFLGRLSRNKGPQYLVEAIPHVLSEIPEASFAFVGDGPMRTSLARRMETLGLNGNVRIHGKVPDVVPVLQRAGVVVRPSLTEGMPLAVMEAMACGRPILAARVGGTADLILDGETGMLFEPRNVEALANGLIRVLADRKQAAAMGRRAREWAERQMTWERVSRTYEQLYEEVAS